MTVKTCSRWHAALRGWVGCPGARTTRATDKEEIASRFAVGAQRSRWIPAGVARGLEMTREARPRRWRREILRFVRMTTLGFEARRGAPALEIREELLHTEPRCETVRVVMSVSV